MFSSIGFKQGLILVALTLFIVVSAIATLNMSREQSNDALYIGAANRLSTTILEIQNHTTALIQALESESSRVVLSGKTYEAIKRFERDLTIVSESDEHYESLSYLLEHWQSIAEKTGYLLSDDVDVMSDEFYSITSGYAGIWPPVSSSARMLARAFEKKSKARVDRLISIQLLVLVAGLLVTGTATILTRRWILSPLRDMSGILRGMTENSDLSFTIGCKRNDEIGQVASSIGHLLEAFKRDLSKGVRANSGGRESFARGIRHHRRCHPYHRSERQDL